MLFKLALRNLTAKPARTLATVIAIAAAVAMIFVMLSFKPAVYEYMYATGTAISGDCEIRISTSSSSDRLTATSWLADEDGVPKLDGIEKVVASLKLYATVGGDYVQVRGFAYGNAASAADDIQVLQRIELADGSLDRMNPDDVVISENAAKHFGVEVGDELKLALGASGKKVYVKALAKDSGYFLADAPYLVLGFSGAMSELILRGVELCNEIYVKAAASYDADELIKRIKAIPQYSSLLVGRAADGAAVEEQSTSLTAPIVLAGAAVMALAVCVIILLFLMGEKEKLALISSLNVIGATKAQTVLLFATEGILLAAAGALLGAGLAVGVFVGVARLTLSASARFTISAWRLLGAEAVGFFAAAASSFLPIARAYRRTARENMLALDKKPRAISAVAALALFAVCVILTALLFALNGLSATAYAALGIVALVMLLVTLAMGLPKLLRLAGRAMSASGAPAVKTAGHRLARDKRPSRSIAVLGAGMAVSMLLFMAWSLTTSIFGAYISDFEDMIIVSNVQADVDVEEFEQADGVKSAVKLVWQQGKLGSPSFDRSVRILGSRDVLELADFAFVTDEATVRDRLNSDEDYVFVDSAFCRLYGLKEGDVVNLSLDGKTSPVIVGGVLSHRLFNGAYVVANEGVLSRLFGMSPDTVIVTASGDIKSVVGELSEAFSSKNYYVIEALEAFRWDMQTVQSVFDLIGTLAFTVAAFILAVCVANTLIGRAGEERSRRALLSAGMSKNMLLASETVEHIVVAAMSFALGFLFCVPMTAGLIAALNLFGLSFEFMFEAWVVAAVGAVMCACYALAPLVLGFKRGYTLKK